jgi:hypothetical protein
VQNAHVVLREKLCYMTNRITHWFKTGKVRGWLPLFDPAQSYRSPANRAIHNYLVSNGGLSLATRGEGRVPHTCVPARLQTSPPSFLPSIFVQMVLPEGRLRLYQAMQSLQAPAAAAAAGASHHRGQSHSAKPQTRSGSDLKGVPARNSSTFYRSSTLDASQIKRSSSSGGSTGCCGRGSKQEQQQPRQPIPIGAPFWRRFAAQMHVLCLGELRHALMAHSCVGVPGIISLLSNLCVTSDFEVENLEKVRCRVQTPA